MSEPLLAAIESYVLIAVHEALNPYMAQKVRFLVSGHTSGTWPSFVQSFIQGDVVEFLSKEALGVNYAAPDRNR